MAKMTVAAKKSWLQEVFCHALMKVGLNLLANDLLILKGVSQSLNMESISQLAKTIYRVLLKNKVWLVTVGETVISSVSSKNNIIIEN